MRDEPEARPAPPGPRRGLRTARLSLRARILFATVGLSLFDSIFGHFIAGFATSREFLLSAPLLFCAGFLSSLYLNLGMTTPQVMVPDELRGFRNVRGGQARLPRFDSPGVRHDAG